MNNLKKYFNSYLVIYILFGLGFGFLHGFLLKNKFNDYYSLGLFAGMTLMIIWSNYINSVRK